MNISFILYLLLSFNSVYAYRTIYSINDGLPHTIINDIHLDNDGFMWFATGKGLCRFDGYNFEVFRSGLNCSDDISYNTINFFKPDTLFGEDIFWCGMNKRNVICFSKKNSAFFELPIETDGLRDVLRIDNRLFLAGETELQMFRIDEEKKVFIRETKLSVTGSPTSIVNDNKGNIWIGSSLGLFKICKNEKYHYLVDMEVNNIFISADNVLWTGTSQGIFYYDTVKNDFISVKIDPQYICDIRDIAEDSNNNLYIATYNNGIFVLSDEKKVISHFSKEEGSDLLLPGNSISTIKIYDNILWIGTFKNGLIKSSLTSLPFSLINQQTHGDQNLRDNKIYAINSDLHGNVWLATAQGGINVYNEDGTFKEIVLKQRQFYPVFRQGFITCIRLDNNNGWFGTINNGMYSFSYNYTPGSGTINVNNIHHYFSDTNKYSLKGWSVRDIALDHDRNVWVATIDKGLNMLNRASGEFTYFDLAPFASKEKSRINEIHCLLMYGNELLIGSREGLVIFDTRKEKGLLLSLTNKPVSIRCLYKDNDNNVWMGTFSDGVFKIEPRNKDVGLIENINKKSFIVKKITTKDGLPENLVYGILEDDMGNLWFSSEKGISRFNLSSGKIRKYTSHDGLPSAEYNFGAFHYDIHKKIMFFGGNSGLTYFKPTDIVDDLSEPKLAFTSLKIDNIPVGINDSINNRVILKNHINKTSAICLSHKEKMISIGFAALHYKNPLNNRYAYRLEGLNEKDKWLYVDGEQRFAIYTGLPPGKYTFMLKGASSDGVWSKSIRTLDIIITPPFWATPIAYLVYFIIAVAVIFITRRITHKIRIERIEHEKERELRKRLHEIDQMKIKFFMNISHEFRTPLTLILGPVEKLVKTEDIPAKYKSVHALILRNANRLLRLVNQLLDLRKLESGNMKLNLVNDDILPFLKKNFEAFDYLSQRHRIKYRFVSLSDSFYCYFDPDVFGKILYNLLSNAFKYTPDGGDITMNVELNKEGEGESYQLKIRIADSGIGIPKEHLTNIFNRFYQVPANHKQEYSISGEQRKQGGTGIGLSLVKELAELHGGSISAVSEPGEYTAFTLAVNLKKGEPEEKENQSSYPSDVTDKYPHITNEADILIEEVEETVAEDLKDDLPLLLIIDDNPDIREFLTRELKPEYRVVTAGNGEDGFNKTVSTIPDLVICDVMMPVMDGIKYCSLVKNDIRTSHIPVILLTAKSSEESHVEGLATGADDYITKPFSLPVLEAKIESVIFNRQKLAKIYTLENGMLIKPQSNTTESAFIDKLNSILEKKFRDPDFDVDSLAKELSISNSQLYRKLKAVSEKSATDIIKQKRIQEAVKMMKSGETRIKEIIYSVGFNSPAYFSTCFKSEMNMTPTDFLKKLKDSNIQKTD